MVGFVEGLLASAAVKIAFDKLSSPVFNPVTEQAGLAWNFSDDLEDMKDTMESIAAVLQDAEKQSIKNATVRLWLKRLKNASWDISDMMDEYQDTRDIQATAKMPGMFSCLSAPRKKIGLANKMKTMREELRKINEQRNSFTFAENIGASQEQQNYDPRETISVVNEVEIIGRDLEKKEITDLLSASHNKDGILVLPIYGLGGMGKSTLAQLVYNDTQFKKYDHRVWVYVSQSFDLNKIGTSIISQLPEVAGQQNTNTLQTIHHCLKNLLSGKKTLVVLDDIWEEDDLELKKLKSMLHVDKKGMIDVIVTTRSECIANKICTIKPYKLQPLQYDVCWDIIKMSSGFEDKPNKEKLEEIGLEIAKKCGGVALAAQALGYMLKSEDPQGWSKLNNSDIWSDTAGVNYNSQHIKVLPSLKLSYEHMLPILRLCFSYCAIFPKGYDISEDDLIHQWAALDFIEASDGRKYINHLLGMSFLQHSKLPSISGKHVVRYTMHDLVHDLSRSVITDELTIIDAAKKGNTSEMKYCRYVLLTNYDGQTKLSNIFPSKVRALHFSSSSKLGPQDGSFSFVKCLRILDFSECSGILLPSTLGQLKQLMCLVAPKTGNETLPDSIVELSKLQYLNLHGSSLIYALPESIGKLGSLKHLDLSACSSMSVLPGSFGDLETLVHLDISGCSSMSLLPKSIGKLGSLKHLDLSGCSSMSVLPESFGDLETLVHVDISGCSSMSLLPESIGKLSSLKHLDLSGCSNMSVLPVSFGDLETTVHLDMSGCSLLKELPDTLGNLTNLQHLDLSECSKIEAVPESLQRLTQLQYLNLSWCSCLERLPESIGRLVDLQYLDMSGCPGITHLPESFTNLQNLLHLNLKRCSICKGLSQGLSGLTALQYLDMSNIYSYQQDGSSLHDTMKNLARRNLHDTMKNLTRLKYLNLSSSISYLSIGYRTLFSGKIGYIDFIGALTNLEHLDLSRNSCLQYLPESIGKLKKLHTLNLSYCPGLITLPDWISKIPLKSLLIEGCLGEVINQASSMLHYSLTLPLFKVQADDNVSACSNLHLLEGLNVPELKIFPLEVVRSAEEARKVKLWNKSNLSFLKLEWSSLGAHRFVDDKDLLEQLVPPRGLMSLNLECYISPSFPSWFIGISHHLPYLFQLVLSRLPTCSKLPPLGQLPNLGRLSLSYFRSLKKIDKELCGGKGAFRQLRDFSIWEMYKLEEWTTTYSVEDDVEEFMFPVLEELKVEDCPRLRLRPCAPIFHKCIISNSKEVISSLEELGNTCHLTSSTPSSILPAHQLLQIERNHCQSLNLFHYFPGLQELWIRDCRNLTSLPESMQQLTSLETLHLRYCEGISALPEWIGNLSSLKSLHIKDCRSLESLPPCVHQLTNLQKLNIVENPQLKQWCESEENSKKLSHVKISYKDC